MAALILTILLVGLGLLGPADSFRARVNRAVYRIVAVAAVGAAFAFMSNHQEQPCTGHQVGAGGMCVSTQAGGVR